jgi:hypothetical protein
VGAGASGNLGAGGAVSAAAGAGANQQVGLQAGAVYTVVQSDTLERIVRRLGARTAAGKNQQMQWVFEHNPAAFYGSMDRLRAGVQLTLPAQLAAANDGSAQQAAASGSAKSASAGAGAAAPGAATSASGANTTNTAAVAGAAVGDRAVQAQLESQVSSLQQTLAKLQETIVAQDAQIAELNRKIAGRAEQAAAERATSALAARIAPEVASVSGERSGAAAARSNASVATSGDDTVVEQRPARWWQKRATYYWAGGLGAAAMLLGLGAATVARRRREAEDLQYKPRYPLVEDSPFRYQATLESPPATPVKPVVVRQPELQVRKPSISGLHVEEGPPQESGLESWSTQTALLLSDLPAADDTQPFMMAPHDEVEVTSAGKRKSFASAEEPTAKLQAMETHTVELQTTGELMSPEELAEAELAGNEAPGGPEHSSDTGKHWNLDDLDLDLGRDDEDETVIAPGDSRRTAANEPGPFGPGGGGGGTRASGRGMSGGSDRSESRDSRGGSSGQSQFDRDDGDAGSSGSSGRGEPGQGREAKSSKESNPDADSSSVAEVAI